MPRDNRDGLGWHFGLWQTVPLWTRQPSVEAIEGVCRQQLNIRADDPCKISFYAAGAFNKLYLVVCTDQSLLMRVSLPVYPCHKVRGEVATLQWLRDHTQVPVPKVIAFDDSNDNDIGFEWMLMELMPGSSAYQRWRKLSMEQKVAITTRIAELQAELFHHRTTEHAFQTIGTLELETGDRCAEVSTAIVPGQLVAHEFFIGPFRSSYDWLASQLEIIILDNTKILETTDDEADKEDAENTLASARGLLSILGKIFPIHTECAETTVLYHNDLSLRNILVDEQGEITAIVDWECVSALPLWMTTRIPEFLNERSREEEPIRDGYGDEDPEEFACWKKENNPNALDNEGKDGLYWIHREEYEATQLRKVYHTRMKQLWPDWPLDNKQVEGWAESIARGDFIRWADAETPSPITAPVEP
ncbi:kinase-like protein [Xylariaceae sp. FL1651]|nr:kinase-like protein [Xylariaceae sp. FL1651]